MAIDLAHRIGDAHMRTKSHPSTETEFDRLLIESLDESFATILGEIPKNTLYDILKKNHAITRNRIPERLNEFTMALETIFGAAPGKVVARMIVKRLYSKLGLTYIERPDWRLPDYVSEAKSRKTLFDDPVELSLKFEKLARS